MTALADIATRLTPLERLESLMDPGSLQLIRTQVVSEQLPAHRRAPGDGVLVGAGTADGAPVLAYAEDPELLAGSLGVQHARSILRVLELAERSHTPVVGFVESAGARLHEGTAALHGYAEIFARIVRLSGVVPQLSVICGTCAGGGSYAPALTDFVIMTRQARMFLTGPGVIEAVTGETISPEELGGWRIQSANGVAHLVAEDDAEAAALARRLLAILTHRPAPVAAGPVVPPGVPADPRQVYDVRRVIAAITDAPLEISARWARNLYTGFAAVEGHPVGVVANQPKHLGGVIDAEAAQKGARFVEACDRFGIPLLVLVDTPGFLPGRQQERAAVIRHGASLVRAFAAARTPKITLTLRKSFGGAHIAMNSPGLGADLSFAWPDAELGVMGAEQAVPIIARRALAAEPGLRAELVDRYRSEHLGAARSAAEGRVDEVITPAETRARLAWALRITRCSYGGMHSNPRTLDGRRRPA